MPDVDRECLADRWCRTTIGYLQDAEDGAASLDDLIDHVVEQETNSSALDRETVTYELVHVQFPTLAAYGVVEYDERTETVRYRLHPERMMDGSGP